MGWSDFDKREQAPEAALNEETMRALGTAAKKGISTNAQRPLRDFLLAKAHAVSYRPGMNRDDISFYEGQRSLALQLLKLSGEIK